MVNSIDRKAVTELMKGYYFYIPSYQRGYRWTSIQVVQLLSDLLCYASSTFNKRIQGINEGEYYCLQPVVARKITDKEVLRKFLPKDAKKDAEAWEIIDGQQRLTTLYILYKYLITKCNISAESLKEDEIELYHLTYATRKGSSAFLANIGNNDDECNDNIDFFHMSQAYETIDKWIRSIDEYELAGAKSLCQRYNLSTKVSDILNIFRSLLNAEKDKYSMYGSVQVLWYELADDKDAIKEFREINTGKIYLTDAELIKALFLRTQNLESQEHIQMQRALEWENIENTLQNDAFWCFLNAKGIDMPNRIDFIFNLRYKMETLSVLNQDDDNLDGKVDTLLRDCETKLATNNFVFNYFYDKFDGKSNVELIQALTTEWDEILNIFHTIEDWYEDVVTYNLIGMLSQYQGNLLPKCYYHFNHMDENESRGEFKDWLKQKICDQTQNITVEQGHIDLSFGDSRIFNLLLLLNVHHLNKQAEGLESQSELSSIYKFPFDVLTKQGWDIEHIDSFTTNGLKEISSKKEWISIALEDLSMNEEERSFINELYEEGELDKAIEKIREIAKEWTDAPEEVKNNIGNLTLLDSGTNRSYGNSLFVVKRRKIIERMKAGIYVPVTTTYVFMKLFDENGTNRSRWGEEDMNKYQAYICDELKDYLNIKK